MRGFFRALESCFLIEGYLVCFIRVSGGILPRRGDVVDLKRSIPEKSYEVLQKDSPYHFTHGYFQNAYSLLRIDLSTHPATRRGRLLVAYLADVPPLAFYDPGRYSAKLKRTTTN